MNGPAQDKLRRLEAWLEREEREAKALPLGAPVHGGPFDQVSEYNLRMHVVRTVRAVLEKP